jgi:hypothetical protein
MRKPLLLLLLLAGLLAASPVAAADDCPFTALDDGCLYTNTGADTADPFDGFAVTNHGGIPFWDFYRGLSVQAVGYPISGRFQLDGLWVQAFQKVILQWQPATNSFGYLNTLDLLAARHPAVELPFLPGHAVLPLAADATFAERQAAHLTLLDANPTIKAEFLGEPDWMNLFGLPIAYEVFGDGAVEVLRAQRAAFAIWRIEAPGVEIGRVVRQNIPDEIKRLPGVLIPESAKTPARQPSIDRVLAACPSAADVALVAAALDLRFDAGSLAGPLVCTAAAGSADLTFIQERTYQAVLLLRRISFSRALPWTDLSLYDWFVASIDGIIFRADFGGAGYCCNPARYMWINPLVLPLPTNLWIGADAGLRGMENYVRALVHEARHVHPEHRRHNCPDGAFDLNVAEGGAYAIEVRFIEWMALYGDRAFFSDLDGNTYWEDMLNNADNVRLWRFCRDDVGYRERGAVTRGVAESGSVGPRTIERWTYAGQAGERLRIYVNGDLTVRLLGPDGGLLNESAAGGLTDTLPDTGTYAIEVHGPPDWTTWYGLELWAL